MFKIHDSFGNIPKQLKLDPQDKINKIEAIAKFFAESKEEESDDLKIDTYFKHYNIDIGHDYDLELLKRLLYRHNKDTDIQNFYDRLFSNKITEYFHDKNAIEEVFKLEKYQDLKAYLDECFNCLQSNNKLACLVILRICLEMFCNFIRSTSNEKPILNLEKKLKKVIDDIKKNSNYKILNSKIDQIEKLLNISRLQGNHVAHCRINEAKRFIEDYCLESNLKLFCIILENSIFKEDILKINEDLKSKKLVSIDFNPQKIENKNNKQPIEETNNVHGDDEIPF